MQRQLNVAAVAPLAVAPTNYLPDLSRTYAFRTLPKLRRSRHHWQSKMPQANSAWYRGIVVSEFLSSSSSSILAD